MNQRKFPRLLDPLFPTLSKNLFRLPLLGKMPGASINHDTVDFFQPVATQSTSVPISSVVLIGFLDFGFLDIFNPLLPKAVLCSHLLGGVDLSLEYSPVTAL